MRHRCWGSVFLEDRLSLFHEARAAAVDRRVHARLRTFRRSPLILQCRQDARWSEKLRALGRCCCPVGCEAGGWCSARGWGATGGGLGVLHGGRGFVQYG